MTESLIRSSSATSSNSDIGNSDSPNTMLPPQYRLIWPLTWKPGSQKDTSNYHLIEVIKLQDRYANHGQTEVIKNKKLVTN